MKNVEKDQSELENILTEEQIEDIVDSFRAFLRMNDYLKGVKTLADIAEKYCKMHKIIEYEVLNQISMLGLDCEIHYTFVKNDLSTEISKDWNKCLEELRLQYKTCQDEN
jgi:hypothetical protein